MIFLIGIKNCNKIKNTIQWFEAHSVEFEMVDVKKNPLSAVELAELSDKVGMDVLVNKRGQMWRKLGLSERNLSDEELFPITLENQNMMNRPILVKGNSVLVGYDEEAFAAFAEE